MKIHVLLSISESIEELTDEKVGLTFDQAYEISYRQTAVHIEISTLANLISHFGSSVKIEDPLSYALEF